MSDGKRTLYERVSGYRAMAAVANDLLPRLQPIHSSASGHIAENS